MRCGWPPDGASRDAVKRSFTEWRRRLVRSTAILLCQSCCQHRAGAAQRRQHALSHSHRSPYAPRRALASLRAGYGSRLIGLRCGECRARHAGCCSEGGARLRCHQHHRWPAHHPPIGREPPPPIGRNPPHTAHTPGRGPLAGFEGPDVTYRRGCTCMHAYVQMRTCTCTRARVRDAHACVHMHTCVHACVYAQPHVHVREWRALRAL